MELPPPIPGLGKRIATAIAEAGFRTVEEFAHVTGIPKSTLSRILRDQADPRLDSLWRIAKGLEIPLRDLFEPPTIGDSSAKPPIEVRKDNATLRLEWQGDEPPAWLKAIARQFVPTPSTKKPSRRAN